MSLTRNALIALTLAPSGAALAQAPAPAVAVAPAVPAARFTDVPNVAVTYYDVTGLTVPQIHESIRTRAPRNPQTGLPVPATSSWSVGVKTGTSTTAGRCRLQSVALRFRATASMPRLLTLAQLSPPVRAAWDRYAAALEGRQAAQLKSAHAQLPMVESQLKNSSCTGWQKDADAALQRLQQQQDLARARDTSPQPMLVDPSPAPKRARRSR